MEFIENQDRSRIKGEQKVTRTNIYKDNAQNKHSTQIL